ncbi:alpha/beta hydrolase [Rhizobium leguminosarum]|uniref:alpha/beta hydrolase n=1 Tax=Rhizobium leguminosarum TaxID=384 RepID=UPI001031B20F|nr:alpha/beta hydrolase [Rhizobium leguminosarum]TAX38952.1 alpha/beta hydrolase [Rhizobium leguminosarum]
MNPNRRTFLLGAAASAVAGSAYAQTRPAKRVVFVHGRAQGGRSHDVILTEWKDALGVGARAVGRTVPVSVEISLPFYGDRLDSLVAQYNLPVTSDVVARGDIGTDPYLKFQAEMLAEMAAGAGITDAEVDAEFDGDINERGIQNWGWVLALARLLDRKSPDTSSFAIEKFLRDVYIYTSNDIAREQIDALVRPALTGEPTIVVAHSLGTVVAYNILRTTGGLNVPLLVTLGSPLAIRAVRRPFEPVRRPEGIGAWLNGFDPRDVVALNPLNQTNFPVEPAIENLDTLSNQTSNRHGISGYLDKPQIVGRVLDALGA